MSEEIIKASDVNVILPEIVRDGINKLGMFVAIDNPDSVASKVAVYNATTESVHLADEIGKEIKVRGIVMRPNSFTDNDGTTTDVITTTLIDENGIGHMAHGRGVSSAITNIMGLFGTPDMWPDTMRIVPISQRGRNGFNFVNLKAIV